MLLKHIKPSLQAKTFKSVFSRGINLLDKKSELEKAMAKHRQATEQKHKEADKPEDGSAFKKMLAERAKRLAKVGDQEPGGS